jgi:hypothetical protein
MPLQATASPGAGVTDGRKGGGAVGARRWWIFAVLGIALLMVVLDVTVVNIALLGVSLAFGGVLLAGGRVGDLFGRQLRTTPNPAVRELDRRSNDGIDVRLLWNSLTNRVSVVVEDQRTAEFFELPAVDPEDALIAFHHPYAYAANDTRTHASEEERAHER